MRRAFGISIGIAWTALGACGGEVTRDQAASIACVDDDIATTADPTALQLDGETVVWGTAKGDVFVREGGATRALGSIGETRVVAIAVDAKSVYAVGDRGLFAFARETGTRSVVLDVVAQPMALASNGTTMCYVERGTARNGTLRCLVGNTFTTLASALDPWDLSLDASNAYVATNTVAGRASRSVARVPLVGGEPTVVAEARGLPFVIDERNVYAAVDGGSTTIIEARFRAWPKAGVASAALAFDMGSDRGSLVGVAVDGRYLYESMGTRVLRRPLAGGASEEIARTSEGELGRIRVNATALYRAHLAGNTSFAPRIEKRCK